jgi:hypothetical protein
VTAVVLEAGAKRVFVSALDWPGWCRSGRDAGAALESLASYLPRYATVAAAAGHPLPHDAAELTVVESLAGTSGTDYGIPGAAAGAEAAPLDRAGAARLVALVGACWTYLDRVAAGAPAELRKGPRGGGRDRDAIVAHVRDAEGAYARKMGMHDKAVLTCSAAVRAAISDLLAEPSDGSPLTAGGWVPRYAARRLAWHALDHAWEIEDRAPSR